MPPEHPATRLLDLIWGPFGGRGLGEIRILPSSRASAVPVKSAWFGDADAATEFVTPYADGEDGYNVYFGVARRARKGGTKKDLLGLSCLYADLDAVNLGWDVSACFNRMHNLPGILQPHAVITSGGGLHAYWSLAEPIMFGGTGHDTRVAEAEAGNAALAKFVSGDNVGNVDRILRVPGTWNCKRGTKCGLGWLYRHSKRGTVAELVAAAEKHGPLFTGPEFPKSAGVSNIKRGNRDHVSFVFRSNIDEMWAKYVQYHASKEPYVGINLAIARTTAVLFLRGLSDEVIVSATLGCVRKVHAEQATNERWDWEAERRHIQKALDRFKKKKAAEGPTKPTPK